MSILTDCHLHSSFSADSEAPMESMIEKGLQLGLTAMCFTEHMDHGMLENGVSFEVDTAAYREGFLKLKEKYRGKIELLFGIELGLEAQYADFLNEYSRAWDFDFIIGSSHTVEGKDPILLIFMRDVRRKRHIGHILRRFRKIWRRFPTWIRMGTSIMWFVMARIKTANIPMRNTGMCLMRR